MSSDSPVNESHTIRKKLEQTYRGEVTQRRNAEDDAAPLWAVLEQQLDRFFQAWEGAPPEPDIGEFISESDSNGSTQRLLLIELVKVDLEFRWLKSDNAKPISEYFERWPVLKEDRGTIAELVYEEIYQRRQRGQNVQLTDYFESFPDSVEELRRLLGLGGEPTSDSDAALEHVRSFSPGDRVDDFDLLGELGQGAFATVFLAVQRSMQRTVALKISRNSGTEAEVLAQLEHPNIVRVYDRRVLPDKDLQLFYMQHIRGGTLRDVLQKLRTRPREEWNGQAYLDAIDERLTLRGEAPEFRNPIRNSLVEASWASVTCDLATQLCRALDYAHRCGVLHRDIKPGNILVTEFGTIKLADFNVSSCQALDGVVPAGYFGGSLAYMSPEQVDAINTKTEVGAEAVDQRSDIYAFGVLLWEVLTGRRPFGDETMSESWEQTLKEMSDRRRQGLADEHWAQLPSDTPPALRSFFERALSPDPSDRFENVQEAALLFHLARTQSESVPCAESGRIARLARRVPLTLLLLAAILPNAMAGWFVYTYNQQESVGADFAKYFFKTQLVINAVLFPLGAALMFWLALPISRAINGIREHRSMSAAALKAGRERCLTASQFVVGVGALEWCAAAVLFPSILTIMGAKLDLHDWINFIGSNVLGGLIAGTYPFFALTFLSLDAWYPKLIEYGTDEQADLKRLAELDRSATLLETLAGALPMLAVVLLVTWGKSEQNELALSVLGVASLIGYIVVSWLARHIRRRLQELKSTLTLAWSDKNSSAV